MNAANCQEWTTLRRNPRRAYNPDGSMIQPATVASQLAAGFRLAEIWCNPCSRHVEVPIDKMPPELPIPDIALHYRCSICGGRNITSRMSIAEFYALKEKGRLRAKVARSDR